MATVCHVAFSGMIQSIPYRTLGCSTAASGAAFYPGRQISTVRELASHGCIKDNETVSMAAFESRVELANTTANTAMNDGSAPAFERLTSTVRAQMCDIRSNAGLNCIFAYEMASGSFRCLSVRSNNCTAYGSYHWLFYCRRIFGAFTITDSAMTGNVAVSLSAGSNMISLRCHFDIVAYSDSFATQNCVTDGAPFPAFPPTCFNRLATVPRSRSQLSSPSSVLAFKQSTVALASPPLRPSKCSLRR
jgi:hypothetical protein